jgi:uncharacterized protein YmfQ (DUF2313 family)
MRAPHYTASDFVRVLQALLPRGRVWPRDHDTTITATLEGLAPTYARQTERDAALLDDAFPASTVELLPEWELTVGLPDACSELAPTPAARRAQVVRKLTGAADDSRAFFADLIASLGFTMTMTEYRPAQASVSRAGDRVYSQEWAFVWTLTEIQAPRFEGARASAQTDLARLHLQCLINRYAPAHIVTQFVFPE